MKRIIAWLLVLVMCLSVVTGCKKNPSATSSNPSSGVTSSTPQDEEVDLSALESAIEYVKTIYKNAAEKTARDYQRIGSVPVGTQRFEIEWTVDVSEDYIKIVRGEDGMVTIDVNEECTEEIPYVLTATVSDGKGNSVSHSWNHILPASSGDMVSIVEAAYQLQPGQSMEYEVTLTGIITAVNTAWSDDYQNITVTIVVTGAEDKPIECYRLKGDGAKDLKVNDIITVTGTLTNYNGKIEFTSGCILDEVIPGEAIEAPSDPKQIVDEAYKLDKNTTLPYEATLTGRIISVDTPYDAGYKNITVTIEVEGRENKPIKCYRLKGAEADTLNVNDIITVKGWIKYYWNTEYNYGEVEFDAGCQLISVIQREEPKQPSDPKVVVDQAYALGKNESLEYEATLTGKIISVDSAYDASYGNVTVTMVIEGRENKPIKCYRMKGNGVDKIKVNDIITVTGFIKYYWNNDYGYGEVEYNYPTLVKYVVGAAETVDPNAKTLSIADAIALGISMGHNTYTSEKYKVTGVIKDVYSTTYGNMHIVDEAGNELTIYGSYSADGSVRYDAMSTKPVAGDTVTIYGAVGQYNGSAQIKNGWIIAHTPGEGTDEPETPVDPETPEGFTPVAATELVENTAYKVYLEQVNLGKTLYFNGVLTSSEYLETTEDVSKAVDVYLEKVTGGVRFYFLDGETKTYIESYINASGKNRIRLATEPTVTYTYSTEAGTYVTPLDHPSYGVQDYYFGTYNTYNTISNSSVIYITGDNAGNAGVTQFVIQFGVYTGSGSEPENPDVPEIPEEPSVIESTIAEVIALGASMEHNVYTTDKYQVTGVITEVYNTQYGNMKIADADGNILTIYGTYDADGTSRYDAMTVKPVAGDTVTILGVVGQYNGTPQIKNGWIVAHVPEGGETPDVPEIPEEPSVIESTIAEVIALGTSMEHNVYTTDKYQVTGVITEVYNTQYGNMKITDEDGNILTIYGTYDADGTNRYDAMEVQPVAGDTVTILGVVGQYNGTPQIKNGWIVAHVPAEGETPDVPEEPIIPGSILSTIAEVITLGTSMEHNVYTEDKYQVTGVITEVYNTQYGNMKITDAEGNILTIYGTYDADGTNRYDAMTVKPVSGDTVTICGIVGQYNGTPQIKNGWIVAHVPAEGETEAPSAIQSTIAEVITLGTSMAHNVYTTEKYVVSGVITEVYNTTYGNMKITDAEGNILTIYGTYDADGINRYDAMESKPVAGDYVTIEGVVGQYNGTPQIKNGWIVANASSLTVADAITLGGSKDHNTYTTEKYVVTGVITEVYNTTYGNMKIADEDGNILTIYGTYDADGTNRYDAMTVKPVAGDTVTILGIVGQYSNTPQIKNGWIIAHTVASSEGGTETPDEPETPSESTAAVLSFETKAAQVSFSTDETVWFNNGITFTNTKGNNDLLDKDGHIRLYAGSTVKIDFVGMIKLVYTCMDGTYAQNAANSLAEYGTVTVDGTTVTLEFDEAIDSFTYSPVSQHRVTKLEVTGSTEE